MRNGLMANHCGTEPHWEKKSGRVDMRSKTNSLTSKPWQTLLTGLSVSQLSSQMPFKPFILFFFTGTLFFSFFLLLWVCVSLISRRKARMGERLKRGTRSTVKEVYVSFN